MSGVEFPERQGRAVKRVELLRLAARVNSVALRDSTIKLFALGDTHIRLMGAWQLRDGEEENNARHQAALKQAALR